MHEEEKAIYMNVWNTRVSQNARYATEDYFKTITPLCPKNPNIAHSLLRTAVRPLSYLGCWVPQDMYSVIETIVKNDDQFLKWLNEHMDLLELCSKELAITYLLSELRFNPSLNQVELDFVRDEEIAGIIPYYNMVTKNLNKINMRFSSFEEFRKYASTFFEQLSISQEEIDLILFEENFRKAFERMPIK